jgi:hypothetical protein
MLRQLLAILTACVLLTPVGVTAEEIRGQVKSVDQARGTITVTVDGKERTFDCAQDAPYMTLQTFRLRRPVWVSTGRGLSAAPPGAGVTLVTQARNGQEMVVEVRQDGSVPGRRRIR